MTFKITLHPANIAFPIQPNETILDAALKHGYMLPFSCREGMCGVCKGRVSQGSVDHGRAQGSVLNQAERAAGMVLFCCAMPESDLTIEYREVNPLQNITVRILPCRVEKMDRVAGDMLILYLRLPANERLQFLAGQHIDILMGNGEQRSFSLGNAPHNNELLELHVRRNPGGTFTHYVFTQLKERSILRIKGPLGNFYLRDSAKPAILMAGGMGIVPIKSIIEEALYAGIKRAIHLYCGIDKLDELYLLALTKQWEARGILVTLVLLEPIAENQWKGKTGSIHQAVMEDYRDLSGYQVYACAGPEIVEGAKRDFVALRGLPEEAFFFEDYGHGKNPALPEPVTPPDSLP